MIAALEIVLENDEPAEISTEMMDELDQLSFLDDEHLWRVAGQPVSDEKTTRIQTLIEKQKAEGVTDYHQLCGER